MMNFEEYRYLVTEGSTPEETAREIIRQGVSIADAIWAVANLFGLRLHQAKEIGADAWVDVHGSPAQDGLGDE